MKYVDIAKKVWRFSFAFTVVDIYRREDSAIPEGHIWPLFSFDVLTIDEVLGLQVTIPCAKLALGFNYGNGE